MLTDEQRAALRARYHAGSDTLDALWNEAYRLGMLRAAEVCDKVGRDADNMGILVTPCDCVDAIRAEADLSLPR